ncbi:MAG: glycosyltransferase N-terminal domain-containing protein [Lentimicrobiaceae bacterium]|nr:glycosyltransferase N-terminal domain-containing protein [Lentimicrobiaceae bacterium]
MFSKFLYNIGIYLYYFGIRISSIFNRKARLWVKGRNYYFEGLKIALERNGFNKPDTKKAWFHCASLGEFEQGRPIIEAFRKQHPDYKILLTFFSPSGYEVRKAYVGADLILYLPIDTPKNAKKFVAITKPDIAFFVKYEFWYNILEQLQKNNIPIVLISGIFRPEQIFFRWYGSWARKILSGYKHIFVQNEDSKQLLEFISINNVSISGDTRFDRVFEVSQKDINFPVLEAFCKDNLVLIGGSTWEKDEELILSLVENSEIPLRYIIAPHEINEERILKLMLSTKCNTIRYTQACINDTKDAKVMILDTIGMLSEVYKYGYIAYVGGGFGDGIHNILEPAAFGLPIIIGPKMSKFQEAYDLIQRDAVTVVHNQFVLEKTVNELINNKQRYKEASQNCLSYIKARTGATKKVMQWLQEEL